MSFNAEGQTAGNMTLSSGGLATGTVNSTVKTVNTISYLINGIFYSRVAADNIALPAPSPAGAYTAGKYQTIPAGMKALFALCLNAAGTFSFEQSALVGGDDPAPVVGLDGDRVVVGVFTVKATTAPFVPGTTALGTGNTVTYYNVSRMPGSSLA